MEYHLWWGKFGVYNGVHPIMALRPVRSPIVSLEITDGVGVIDDTVTLKIMRDEDLSLDLDERPDALVVGLINSARQTRLFPIYDAVFSRTTGEHEMLTVTAKVNRYITSQFEQKTETIFNLIKSTMQNIQPYKFLAQKHSTVNPDSFWRYLGGSGYGKPSYDDLRANFAKWGIVLHPVSYISGAVNRSRGYGYQFPAGSQSHYWTSGADRFFEYERDEVYLPKWDDRSVKLTTFTVDGKGNLATVNPVPLHTGVIDDALTTESIFKINHQHLLTEYDETLPDVFNDVGKWINRKIQLIVKNVEIGAFPIREFGEELPIEYIGFSIDTWLDVHIIMAAYRLRNTARKYKAIVDTDRYLRLRPQTRVSLYPDDIIEQRGSWRVETARYKREAAREFQTELDLVYWDGPMTNSILNYIFDNIKEGDFT